MDKNGRSEPWPEPVIVQNGSLTPVVIHGAEEAMEFMEIDWPAAKERHHKIAREVCRASLLRQVSGDAARETFIKAVQEARINVCAPEPTASDA
jgi:hypothetical protein